MVVVAAAGLAIWLVFADGRAPATSTSGAGDSTTSHISPSTSGPAPTETTAEPDTSAPGTVAFGESVEVWNTSMTVSQPTLLDDPGVQAILGVGVDIQVVEVSIANTGGEVRDYNLFYWEASDEDGMTYGASLYLEDRALDSGEIVPGQTVEGYVGFEVPSGTEVVSIRYSPILAGATVTWER